MKHHFVMNFATSRLAAALSASLLAGSAIALPMAQGPLLTASTAKSAHVWARWSSAATIYVKYRSAAAPSFVVTKSVSAKAENDFTSSFSLDQLTPNTTYEYRFVSIDTDGSSEESAAAYFETSKKKPSSVSFSVLSDFSLKLKTSRAVVSASRPRPDFIAVIGDWDHRGPAHQPGTNGAYPPSEEATVLENFRQMHRDTRDPGTPIGADIYDSFMKSSRKGNHQVPLYYAWDDHDFCMNNAGLDCPFSTDAFQAYEEYFHPSDDNGLGSLRVCGSRGDWQSFTYGNVAAFFMLDARSNRVDETTILGTCQLQC